MATTNELGWSDAGLGNIELGAPAMPPLQWYTPLSVPTRRRPSLRVMPPINLNQDLEPAAWTEDPPAQYGSWHAPMSMPRRRPATFSASPPLGETDPAHMGDEETVYPAAFNQPWPLPRKRRDTYHFPFGMMDLVGRAEAVPVEVLAGMGVPTRPRLRLPEYPAFALQLVEWGEVIKEGWFTPLSLPVPKRRPIRLPWTMAFEEYDPSTFETIVPVLYKPEMWGAGF